MHGDKKKRPGIRAVAQDKVILSKKNKSRTFDPASAIACKWKVKPEPCTTMVLTGLESVNPMLYAHAFGTGLTHAIAHYQLSTGVNYVD